jgi:hypothetical protein
MVKAFLLITSAIAFALVLVVIMVTGYGAVSVFGSASMMLLTVGIATLALGLLVRDDCGPVRPCF